MMEAKYQQTNAESVRSAEKQRHKKMKDHNSPGDETICDLGSKKGLHDAKREDGWKEPFLWACFYSSTQHQKHQRHKQVSKCHSRASPHVYHSYFFLPVCKCSLNRGRDRFPSSGIHLLYVRAPDLLLISLLSDSRLPMLLLLMLDTWPGMNRASIPLQLDLPSTALPQHTGIPLWPSIIHLLSDAGMMMITGKTIPIFFSFSILLNDMREGREGRGEADELARHAGLHRRHRHFLLLLVAQTHCMPAFCQGKQNGVQCHLFMTV